MHVPSMCKDICMCRHVYGCSCRHVHRRVQRSFAHQFGDKEEFNAVPADKLEHIWVPQFHQHVGLVLQLYGRPCMLGRTCVQCTSVHRDVYQNVYGRTRVQTCLATSVRVCIEMCIKMCMEMRVHACAETCVEMCTATCVLTCVDMYRRASSNVH